MRRKILILFLFLLLFSVNVHAGFLEAITSVPQGIVDVFFSFTKQEMINFLKIVLDITKYFMTVNPNPMIFFDLWKLSISTLNSFYLLLFLIASLRFLVSGYSPEQRKKAKEWLKNAILILILVNASLFAYTIILDLGEGVTLTLWNNGLEQTFSLENLQSENLFLIGFLTTSAATSCITTLLRYLILILGVPLFPIGVFLYLIPPLKQYGKLIFNFIIAGLFIQILDVLILLVSNYLFQANTALEGLKLLSPAIGFTLITLFNIGLILFALIKAGSTIIENVPGTKTILTSTAAAILG